MLDRALYYLLTGALVGGFTWEDAEGWRWVVLMALWPLYLVWRAWRWLT